MYPQAQNVSDGVKQKKSACSARSSQNGGTACSDCDVEYAYQ